MHPVTSTNVKAVGYEASTRTLRVQFDSGRTYDYFDVEPALFEHMLLPYPWRQVGRLVKLHRYSRVA